MDYILNHPYIIFFLFLGISSILMFLPHKLPAPKNPEVKTEKAFCINHKETRSTSICHICSNPFCPDCIRNHSTLSFCTDHFKLLFKYQWIPILSFQITSDQNEDGVVLQSFKEMVWNKEKIPSYIVVEYRINFEQDLIESHVSYFTREQDQDLLKRKFRVFKDQA